MIWAPASIMRQLVAGDEEARETEIGSGVITIWAPASMPVETDEDASVCDCEKGF